ncbi:MAG: flagellar M-ring protein FliF [Chloroflexi bacterium]|nr:flagellar M-ring protein FliF [Chloroflexota bacterium]
MLKTLWTQLVAVWQRMTRVQRIVFITLMALGVALVGAFTWWASTPVYSVAFTGLSEADAGAIVEKLKAQGIPYKLEDGGTILVPSNQVYDVRLSMAKDGLPNGSTVGFELFNSNTLGLTEFSQKVNYRRALEGELARTIESLDPVKGVRVHIVIPETALFTEQQKPTTASITVQLKPGQNLNATQVQAITNLVASSVEGLTPDNVVIVDTNGKMLSATFQSEDALSMSLSEEQQQAQRKYEAAVEAKITEMLEQALGPQKSIVKVNARLNWDKVEETLESFDPENVVRSSSTITETYTGSGDLPGGIPGASSNLPEDTAPTYQTTATETAATNYERSEVTTNYEVTTTQTHTLVAPGQVDRLTVSVLVDSVTDQATLDALNPIVVMAAGIDTARGDEVTVQSIAFDRTAIEAQEADMQQAELIDLLIRIGIWVAIALVLIALLWYMQKLIANLRLRAGQDVWTPLIGAPGALRPAVAGATPAAVLGASTDSASATIAALAAAQAATTPAPDETPQAPAAPAATPAPAIPVYVPHPLQHMSPEAERTQKALSKAIEQRPSIAAEIIRLWLDEDAQRK